MKRNLNENSTRSTAGCLSVPLFNQKKRNRQPLTSNPLKNDPGSSSASDSYDFPPLPTDWAWEATNPELASLTKTVNTRQIPPSVSCPLKSQGSMPKSIQSNTERSQHGWSYRNDNKNTSMKTWDKSDFRPQHKRTSLVKNDEIYSIPMNLGAQQQKQLGIYEPHNLIHHRETEMLRQTHSSKISDYKIKSQNKSSILQTFKSNFQENQFKKQMLDDFPEENTTKEIPLCQLQFKKKNNSLRIISAVIESMKYWREHAQNAVLLFEILGS